MKGEVLRLQLAGVDVEPVDGTGFIGQDEVAGFYLVGAALGALAASGGDCVDGAIGIHECGGMGRQMALPVQDEIFPAQGQGDGGRFRPGIGHKHFIGAGPLGIGQTGLLAAQEAAGRAKQCGRQDGKQVSHRNLHDSTYSTSDSV